MSKTIQINVNQIQPNFQKIYNQAIKKIDVSQSKTSKKIELKQQDARKRKIMVNCVSLWLILILLSISLLIYFEYPKPSSPTMTLVEKYESKQGEVFYIHKSKYVLKSDSTNHREYFIINESRSVNETKQRLLEQGQKQQNPSALCIYSEQPDSKAMIRWCYPNNLTIIVNLTLLHQKICEQGRNTSFLDNTEIKVVQTGIFNLIMRKFYKCKITYFSSAKTIEFDRHKQQFVAESNSASELQQNQAYSLDDQFITSPIQTLKMPESISKEVADMDNSLNHQIKSGVRNMKEFLKTNVFVIPTKALTSASNFASSLLSKCSPTLQRTQQQTKSALDALKQAIQKYNLKFKCVGQATAMKAKNLFITSQVQKQLMIVETQI